MRNGPRLGFLLTMMTLDHLKQLGLAEPDATRRPSHVKILHAIDKQFRTFTQANRRLLGSIADAKKINHTQFEYFASIQHGTNYTP